MLTLIVPGLVWPHQALTDLTRDLALPAFTTLLGRGHLVRHAGQTSHESLTRQLGLPHPLPAAALRALAAGHEIDAGDWLCLDPLHLRFEQNRLMVDDPEKLALTPDEATQLAVALAPTFASLGDIVMISPLSWNLKLTQPVPRTAPLPELIGRATPLLPPDAVHAPWRQALNEAQIALHTHPVNQAREAAGRPVINSLWPWGGGHLPLPPTSIHSAAHDAIWSDDPVAQGAARFLNLHGESLPARYGSASVHTPFTGASAHSPLILIDSLACPTRTGDAMHWRERLLALETDWLAPLHDALRHGRIKGLRLIAPGEAISFELTASRHDYWRFWRFWHKPATAGSAKPAALTRFASNSP